MSDLDFIAKVKWFKGAAKVKWCMVGVAKIKRSRMSPRSKTANSAASNNCCQAVAGESDFIAFISWPSALTRKGGDLRNVPRREMLQNTTAECCSSSNISKIQTVDADNIKAHPCSSRHRLLLYVCVLFDGLDQNAGHVSALSFDSENAADPQMAVQQIPSLLKKTSAAATIPSASWTGVRCAVMTGRAQTEAGPSPCSFWQWGRT